MTLNNYRRAYEKLSNYVEYLAVHDAVNFTGEKIPEHLVEIRNQVDGEMVKVSAKRVLEEAQEMVK